MHGNTECVGQEFFSAAPFYKIIFIFSIFEFSGHVEAAGVLCGCASESTSSY